MNAKAKSYLLAASLAVNVVLLGMLLRLPSQPTPNAEDDEVASAPLTEDQLLPLPATSVPLSAPALLPPVEPQGFDQEPSPAAVPQARISSPDEEKPYAAPPPPNPYASPPWPERLPYRESQMQRALLREPKR